MFFCLLIYLLYPHSSSDILKSRVFHYLSYSHTSSDISEKQRLTIYLPYSHTPSDISEISRKIGYLKRLRLTIYLPYSHTPSVILKRLRLSITYLTHILLRISQKSSVFQLLTLLTYSFGYLRKVAYFNYLPYSHTPSDISEKQRLTIYLPYSHTPSDISKISRKNII